MLSLFRSNSPFTVIILFIVAWLSRLQSLLHPQLPVALPGYFLYNYILKLLSFVLGASPFGFTIFAVLLLFGQAMYVNRIATRHKLFIRTSYIPAYTFLALTAVYPPFSYFGVTLLLNWVLLGAMDIILRFSQTGQPRKHIFNAAFIFCLAALFQFSALGFILLFFISLAMLRPFNMGEWVVGIMGYATPLYFLAAILFLADNLGVLHQWPQMGFSYPLYSRSGVFVAGAASGVLLLFACSLYAMQLQLPKINIYIRRNWAAIVFYLFASLGVAACTGSVVTAGWLIAIPALAFFISNALMLEKSKRFSNFIFYFSIILIVFCQLAYK